MTAEIHDIDHFRNRNHVFKDRSAAGDFLARMLDPFYRGENIIVLAIPSGGVPVGIRIAEYLNVTFDLVIVRKLQIPGNPEAGFGAMTQEGSIFLNESLLAHLNLPESDIKAESQRVREDLNRRKLRFSVNQQTPNRKHQIRNNKNTMKTARRADVCTACCIGLLFMAGKSTPHLT